MKKVLVVSSVAVMLAMALFLTLFLVQRESKRIKLVTREVSLGRVYPDIFVRSLIVSPDSKRVAYVAVRGKKQLVVVEGKEEKEYDGIGEGTLVFSPDSKRVAYVAVRGKKQLVVVEGKESNEYDGFLRGSKLVFDSPKLLHTLAHRGVEFFLVEVEIVDE